MNQRQWVETQLADASIELNAFWTLPEADILRGGEPYLLVLVDQRDHRHHLVLRQLGVEPNLDPSFSRWTTLVLPSVDFAEPVRAEAARKRAPDYYPMLLIAEGTLVVVEVPDARAQARN